MLRVGAVLSTVKVPLGPAAADVLPAVSLAVAAAMLTPSVPLPVIPLMRTVGVALVPFRTLTVPFAVLVLFCVTFAASRLMVFAPL